MEKLEDGQLVITGVKDFQIVNGGQTTASLFHTEKKFKADLSQVFVQMKLTVIKDEDKKKVNLCSLRETHCGSTRQSQPDT